MEGLGEMSQYNRTSTTTLYSIATIPQHLTFILNDSLHLVYPYLVTDIIGKRIYKIRKRRRLLQKELAAMINVRYQVIWKAETHNIISETVYKKLLEVLEKDLLIT